MFIFCFCSRPTLFNIVTKNDLGRLYFYRDFYLYCSRPIQHQYYCIVIVYYCFLLWCWMNIKVEVEVEADLVDKTRKNLPLSQELNSIACYLATNLRRIEFLIVIASSSTLSEVRQHC